MNPERWQQIDRVFQSALERAPSERVAYLNEACADDAALRREVELLLAADEQAETFTPAIELAAPLLAANETPSLAGQSISHYQIISLLGQGGMGAVWRARDTKLDRTVALKTLPAHAASDDDSMRRFVSEAKAASALNHPHVATIYEIGEVDGLRFIAMEYVAGQTLAAKINGAPLALNELIAIASQMADALDEAHNHGITHRDIKPANVMLNERGQVKVLDFGLAKITRPVSVDSQAGTLARTQTGVVMGTVPYMSPEQALGHEVDHRTDIFSLGVVLYEMATGRLPFAGATTSETLDRILHSQPDALARFNYDAPVELERIVRKCLEKERERRYQSARELLVDLKNLRRDSEPPVVRTEQVAAPTKGRLARFGWAAVVLVLVTLLGVGIYWLKARGQTIESVAVLPFVNVSADPDTEYLSDGISESLINSLSQLPRLAVMSRDSAFRYKGRTTSAQAAGQELQVQAVLTGRVTQRGEDLSISIELVEVRSNRQIWGEQYRRQRSNLQQVQEEITREISDKLRQKLTGAEQQLLAKRYTQSAEAHELYLKGRYFWNKGWAGQVQKGIECFNQAIVIDPNYALAYAGLADAYWGMVIGQSDAREMMPKARDAALKALALEPDLAEARISLANVHAFYEADWAEAEREYKQARALKPNLAEAHLWYGYYLSAMGRHPEALAETKQARQLDPLSLRVNQMLGGALYYARKYDEAITQSRKTLEMDAHYPIARYRIGLSYTQQGKYPEAIAEFEEELRSSNIRNSVMLGVLARAYALAGKKDEARKLLEEAKTPTRGRANPWVVAVAYDALGEQEQAFAWLERAYQERPIPLFFLQVDPVVDSLRADPRFAALVRRLGLQP